MSGLLASSVPTASLFFALLAVAAEIAVVVGLVLWLGGRRSTRLAEAGRTARDAVAPSALWLAWVVALTCTLGSLYLSEIAHFVPCKLCWYQRIAMASAKKRKELERARRRRRDRARGGGRVGRRGARRRPATRPPRSPSRRRRCRTFEAAGSDPAVGMPAPTLEGESFDGTPVTIDPGSTGSPTAIWFLAHWCPHCQAEVPRSVSLAEQGLIPGGSTSTRSRRR